MTIVSEFLKNLSVNDIKRYITIALLYQTEKGIVMPKKYIRISYIAILILIVLAVARKTKTNVFASNASYLSMKSIQIEEGNSKKLIVKNAEKTKIKWSSSNINVVTVTQKGTVKAKNTGTAKIRCVVKINSKTKTLTCNVKVVAVPNKIKITVDDKVLTATMENNKLAKDLMDQMPFTITLQDLANEEKYGYPPKTLVSDGMNSGYDPSVGDICCYAPWGNVCIYYADHGYEDLIKLGKIDENGEEILASYPSNVKVEFDVLR